MKILAIVQVNLVRASRDRTALFFSVLLPLILILVLGLTYGSGSSARIGLVDDDGGPLAARLVADLAASSDLSVEVRRYDSLDVLRDAASRGIVQVGIEVPAGYTTGLQSGGETTVTLVVPPTAVASAIRTMAELAIAAQASLVRAARFAGATNGRSFEANLEAASTLAATLPGVGTTVVPINAADTSRSGYDAGAQGQLILFMFLTSLTGAAELVITRQLGISRRMFSTPTGLWTIIVGESMARIAFALVQGLFIVAASAILFGVRWGDPIALGAIVLAFALVSGGAAMLVGSIASNPSQAGAIGPALAMILGLLGGAMVPAEVFPDAMRQLSHLTPHAWAVEALHVLGEPGSGISAVAQQVAILGGFALVFFAIAVTRFRRVLQRGS
jgi:ABC-2 type transport system permease protein